MKNTVKNQRWMEMSSLVCFLVLLESTLCAQQQLNLDFERHLAGI
jgi:hypothetical protein